MASISATCKETLQNHIDLSKVGDGTIMASWKLMPWAYGMVSEHLGQDWGNLRLFLRINDVTDVIFDGTNAHDSIWVDVTDSPGRLNINEPTEGRDYLADIGTTTWDGKFLPMASSQTLRIH